MNIKNNNYLELFTLQKAVRDFFTNQDFLEVITPPMVSNPGMEVHIHPFEVYSKKDGRTLNQYLHTSPEFHMKNLLSEGFEKIFTMSYCFRDEPSSSLHRNQFVMLEWYRLHANYEEIMNDLEKLILFCSSKLKREKVVQQKAINKKTIQEIFQEVLNLDILEFVENKSNQEFKQVIEENYKDVPLPEEELSFEDYFFLLFLNKIEPELKKYPFIILYEYPAPLKALSSLKKEDPRVCERFELYANGIELCNCFQELSDLNEQTQRFDEQAILKEQLYQYKLPEARLLYNALEKGIPRASGIALGIERLLMILTGCENPFLTD
ncbi:MAG: EF-P lysine aminoacylase GenX [Bacteriovoracaceae bacterium]|jgi:elongation factor P--(R)-beta-lysine ligase|nr:EF-P lysine aminoacylase GenX [Bacteriovoracaceae bacterium]